MKILWSLKGKKYAGRAYFKRKFGSIMLNVIFRDSKDYHEFLRALYLTFFHEYLHLFLKWRLGKYAYSEPVIEELSYQLYSGLWKDDDFIWMIVEDFWDVRKAFIQRKSNTSGAISSRV